MPTVIDELDAWLDAQWDPELTVGDWWARLASAGWASPSLPAAAGGRGLPPELAPAVADRWRERGVLGPPGGTAMAVVLPTILEHGIPGQVERLVPPILAGQAAWCLLLSEPNAGTDLAALTTAAVLDGDEWVVDGRKTWATGAHLADHALLLARTEPDTSRHRGLTALIVDLRQTGVEIRPMREMTGRALSNDVFLTAARLPATAVLGRVGGGWAVVQTAVASERAAVGGAAGPSARPGAAAGDLARRAGDVVGRPGRRARPASESPAQLALRVAADRAELRHDLARLHIAAEVARLTAQRAAASELPGAANIAKLWAGEIARRAADVASRAAGASATLHEYADGTAAPVTALVLNTPAVSLVGGNDFVQRDQLAERVLGLPKSPTGER